MTQRALQPPQSPQQYAPSPYQPPPHSHSHSQSYSHSRNSSLSASHGPPSVAGSRGSTSSFYGSLPAQGTARPQDGYAHPEDLARSAPPISAPASDAGHWRRASGHRSPFPPYDFARAQQAHHLSQHPHQHMLNPAPPTVYAQAPLYRGLEDTKPRHLGKAESGSYGEAALPSLSGGSVPLRYSSNGSGSFDNSAPILPDPQAQASYQYQPFASGPASTPSPALQQQQSQGQNHLPGLAQMTNLPSPVLYGTGGSSPYAYQQAPTPQYQQEQHPTQQGQQYHGYAPASGPGQPLMQQGLPQMQMHSVQYDHHHQQQRPPLVAEQAQYPDGLYRHPPPQEPVYHDASSRSSSSNHIPAGP